MKMLKKLYHLYTSLFLLYLVFPNLTAGQEVNYDSIKNVLLQSDKKQKPAIHNYLAREYYNENKIQYSLTHAKKALTLAKEVKNHEQVAKAYNRIGFIYREEKDYLSSLKNHKKAIESAKKVNYRKEILKAYNSMEIIYYYLENYDKFKEYSEKTLLLSRELENQEMEAIALQHLGLYYYRKGLYKKALDHWKQQLEILKISDNQEDLATVYLNIGVIYKNWGKYEKAIENYQNTLKIQEHRHDTLGMARSVSNIGNVYFYFEVDIDKALDYYKRGYKLFKSINDTTNMANLLNSIGIVYQKQKKYPKALENFKLALEHAKKINNKTTIAKSQTNMGAIYIENKQYSLAKKYIFNALEKFKELKDKKEIALSHMQIGQIYMETEEFQKALSYYKEALKLLKEMDLPKELLDTYKQLSELHAKIGNNSKALDYYKNYSQLKDSTLKDKYLENIEEQRTKYQTEKKEERIKYLNEKNKRQEAENKRQRVLIYSAMGGLMLILIFSLLLFKQYNDKRKANILLEEQNVEISQQRDQIFRQKQEITDSIQYASRIQKAIIPPEDILDDKLPDHFIYFRPRDIVSGDFYWLNKKDNKTYFTAADCTGHGVPGAFMSMLGIAFMNEIVNKYKDIKANEILNELRKYVVDSLHQTGKSGEAQDGMDIALCILDQETNTLHFSGAYNPLIMIRNGELTEYKGDKMPIGIYHEKNDRFTNHEIKAQKGDCLYIFSDGYVDQFGGDKGKKFFKKRFKEMLLTIHNKPMKEQYQILDQTMKEWSNGYSQVDDILIIGVRV